MNNDKSLVLETRDYTDELRDTLLALIVLLLFGFGLIIILIDDDYKAIGSYSALTALFVFIVGYLNVYFFRNPKITGSIVIRFEEIDFQGTLLKLEDVEYFAIRYLDYRGRVVFKKYEYPLPQLGINNEIKIKVKSGKSYATTFFVGKKKDRNKIDPYINYWQKEGVNLDYIIGDELIVTNKKLVPTKRSG